MDAPAPSKPSRRWHRRRLLRYLVVLLAVCVAGYFVWDALFMPADLRRMQGSWKVVRVVQHDHYFRDIDRMVIAGQRLTLTFLKGDRPESCTIDIVPKQHELVLYEPREMTIFGATIRLPIWVKGEATQELRYELDGSNLTLRLPRNMQDDGAAEWGERRVELVREDD